jgi:hypothetical protein
MRVSAVTETEINSALSSSFKDFEDAIDYSRLLAVQLPDSGLTFRSQGEG